MRKTIKKIIVIGGGGHGKVVISILKKLKQYEVVGYTDVRDKGSILGVKCLGNDENISNFGGSLAAVGIGILSNSESRRKIIDRYLQKGSAFPPIISPDAVVNKNVSIGAGTVIMDGVVINTGTSIGNYSIINTRSSIDHDCKIGNNVHVAPGATLCGCVKIGDNCLVGTGSTIIQNIKLDEGCIVGASTLINKNCNKRGRYFGIPARRKK